MSAEDQPDPQCEAESPTPADPMAPIPVEPQPVAPQSPAVEDEASSGDNQMLSDIHASVHRQEQAIESLSTLFLPSNDAFIANGNPFAHILFDMIASHGKERQAHPVRSVV